MALLIYRILLFCLLPLILVLALLRSINHKAYRQRLGERLGKVPAGFQSGGIVIHAASVGEIIALSPFIRQCLAQFNDLPLTVTTFTPTGSTQVTKLFDGKVQHCYLPLDIWPCTRLFLHTLKPKALVMMETELWPNLITHAAKQGSKLLLVNGRISDKSLPSYQKFSALVAPCLQQFDQILAQSEDNAQRLILLGANEKACLNGGNLKYDLTLSDEVKLKQQTLAELLPSERPIWLLASSHQGDESIAINSYKQLVEQVPNCLLIIVPRHPERFESVAKLLAEQQLSYQKRSNGDVVEPDTDIWLLDTLGELMAVLPFANVVTMGGTFSNIGGHNPLEPALYKKPVIVGQDMANFVEVYQQLKHVNGIVTLPHIVSEEQLIDVQANTVVELLKAPEKAQQIGENAYQVVQQNQGATARAINVLDQLLSR